MGRVLGAGGDISIHAPRGGSDSRLSIPIYRPFSFQSTLPAGGATLPERKPSPAGSISIHAPRGGSDWLTAAYTARYMIFQSTLPAGGATNLTNKQAKVLDISIHAPRGESDQGRQGKFPKGDEDFNPRSPRGERLWMRFYPGTPSKYFNPRSPRGERLFHSEHTV